MIKKIIPFLIVVFISGCGICEKKSTTSKIDNSIVETTKNLENKISFLSGNEKNELKSIFVSMRFSLSLSNEVYFNKVKDLKNKYSINIAILECIDLLDNEVCYELSKGNRIKAKHLIHNAVNLLN